MSEIIEKIKSEIENNDIILYMKGTADQPQCGFSSMVVTILKKFNLNFKAINVLRDEEIRESIKIYSDWPTIPQLYVRGKFIGGCDIVKQMYEAGEFESLLREQNLY